jgi:hypothetical protein
MLAFRIYFRIRADPNRQFYPLNAGFVACVLFNAEGGFGRSILDDSGEKYSRG